MEANGEVKEGRLLMAFIPPRILVGIDGGLVCLGDEPVVPGERATHGRLKRAVDLVPLVNQRTGEMQINGVLLGDVTYPVGAFAVCELVKDSAYRKAYYAIAANIHLA